MVIDSFWASQIQKYTEGARIFFKQMRQENLSDEIIQTLWLHFRETTCDCEGCREDSDCVLHIEIPDAEDDWDNINKDSDNL